MNEQFFDELINMYKGAVEEAQSLWLSHCCCSSEEACERKEEDEKELEKFIALCNRIRGDI